MKHVFQWICVSYALCLAACTYDYSQTLTRSALSDVGLHDQHHYARHKNWSIRPNTKIAVVLSDARRDDFPRSYQMLKDHVATQFTEYFSDVYFLPETSHLASNASAFTLGCELLIYVKLVDIENNLNTRRELGVSSQHYPGRDHGRDALSLQLLIYETQTHRLLDHINVSSKAAYFKNGDSLALDLIENALSNILAELSGKPPSPPVG